MPYPMHRRLKKHDLHTPEEQQVYGIVVDYAQDPENADLRYFVPTRVLYEAYREWWLQFEWRWVGAPQLLTPEQFGSALRQVFPELCDHGRRVKRTYKGRREWGYLGLKGPGSIISHTCRGRPKRRQTV